jgi:hypothetical protein
METTRRSFLKLIAIAGATAASPKILGLVTEDSPGLALGNVRELFQFDINRPATIVRLDIATAPGPNWIQLGVDGFLPTDEHAFYRQADLDAFRQSALAALQSEMEKRGISVDDLVPLPVPAPYQLNKIKPA